MMYLIRLHSKYMLDINEYINKINQTYATHSKFFRTICLIIYHVFFIRTSIRRAILGISNIAS